MVPAIAPHQASLLLAVDLPAVRRSGGMIFRVPPLLGLDVTGIAADLGSIHVIQFDPGVVEAFGHDQVRVVVDRMVGRLPPSGIRIRA